MNWDDYFMMLAKSIAIKSKDPSTQCGAIVVYPDMGICSTGFNGFPRGVDDSELRYLDRGVKYMMVEHAERNAIDNAARHGHSVDKCNMYVTAPPCCDCAKSIIQSGIKRIVTVTPDTQFSNRWAESSRIASIMFKEAGVEYVQVD